MLVAVVTVMPSVLGIKHGFCQIIAIGSSGFQVSRVIQLIDLAIYEDGGAGYNICCRLCGA